MLTFDQYHIIFITFTTSSLNSPILMVIESDIAFIDWIIQNIFQPLNILKWFLIKWCDNPFDLELS